MKQIGIVWLMKPPEWERWGKTKLGLSRPQEVHLDGSRVSWVLLSNNDGVNSDCGAVLSIPDFGLVQPDSGRYSNIWVHGVVEGGVPAGMTADDYSSEDSWYGEMRDELDGCSDTQSFAGIGVKYFHDGRVRSVADIIRRYRHRIGNAYSSVATDLDNICRLFEEHRLADAELCRQQVRAEWIRTPPPDGCSPLSRLLQTVFQLYGREVFTNSGLWDVYPQAARQIVGRRFMSLCPNGVPLAASGKWDGSAWCLREAVRKLPSGHSEGLQDAWIRLWELVGFDPKLQEGFERGDARVCFVTARNPRSLLRLMFETEMLFRIDLGERLWFDPSVIATGSSLKERAIDVRKRLNEWLSDFRCLLTEMERLCAANSSS